MTVSQQHRTQTAGELEGRLSAALEEYYAALDAGHPPDRAAFLAEHAEVADQLAGCLDSLEFVRAVSPQLGEDAGGGAIRPLATLGDFRIVREIGRGGMGVVYEAEQLSLGRSVALKVLPFAAMLDKRQLQRFKNEAMAAAALDHPNIVHVYGVGSDRGVHFYAMQLIEGMSLAEVIADMQAGESGGWKAESRELLAAGASQSPVPSPQSPSSKSQIPNPKSQIDTALALTTQRESNTPAYFRTVARLGIQAAEALDHAHAQGVIHRDIKPANLLIDEDGNLHVTDFGLARIEADAGMTMTGDVLGTLRYMSPEQASGKQILDQRSDIYSLGATLYELLTLQPVFAGNDRQMLLRQIPEQDPRPPRQLNNAIPKDLETIVLKAIAKEPQSRYATAQALAEDLRRFLEDKPIRARRPRLLQRAAKWSRRHKPVVWSAAVLFLMATVGLAANTILVSREQAQTAAALKRAEDNLTQADAQRRRAEENLLQACQAVDEYFTLVSESTLLDQPALVPLRKQLLEAATKYYEEFSTRQSNNPRIQAELAASHLRLAQVYYHTGSRDLSYSALAKGVELVEKLLAEHPEAADLHLKLAGFWHGGRASEGLQPVSDPSEAVRILQQAASVWEQLAQKHPTVTGFQSDLSKFYDMMSGHQSATGRTEEAMRSAKRICEIREKIVRSNPGVAEHLSELGHGYLHLGDRMSISDPDEAEKLYHRSLSIQNDLPNLATYQSGAAWTYRCLAFFLKKRGRLEEAAEAFHQAHTGYAKLADQFPNGTHYRHQAGAYEDMAHSNRLRFADLLKQRGRLQEAEEIFSQLTAGPPKDAQGYFRRAGVYKHLKKYNEALEDYERAAELGTSDGQLHKSRGDLYMRVKEFRKALADYNQAIQIAPDWSYTYKRRGLARFHLEEYDKALADITQAVELNPTDTSNLTWISPSLVAKCPDKAFRDGILKLADKTIEMTNGSVGAYVARGTLYAGLGQHDKGLPDYKKAIELGSADARIHNSVAWFSIRFPDGNRKIVGRAVQWAGKATELAPESGNSWNTLGVAQYRAGDWIAAIEALEKSEEIDKGKSFSFNGFFLAMAHGQLGNQDQAQRFFQQAVTWMQKNRPDDKELIRFRTEAEQLLGIEKQKSGSNESEKADH